MTNSQRFRFGSGAAKKIHGDVAPYHRRKPPVLALHRMDIARCSKCRPSASRHRRRLQLAMGAPHLRPLESKDEENPRRHLSAADAGKISAAGSSTSQASFSSLATRARHVIAVETKKKKVLAEAMDHLACHYDGSGKPLGILYIDDTVRN